MITTEQKLLCALSHLGTFVGIPILAPLIVLLVTKNQFVKQQSKEALGFQLFLLIAAFVTGILYITVIGIPIAIILTLGIALLGIILPIIAIIKVIDGIDYSYPVTGKFIRKNF